jgi:hypothetical protein
LARAFAPLARDSFFARGWLFAPLGRFGSSATSKILRP